MISDSPLFQQSITVYNRYIIDDFGGGNSAFPPSMTQQIKYDRTIIQGVAWKEEVKINADNTGLSVPAKSITIVIPLEAAQRVEREQGKTFVKPQEFAKLPQDNFNHWTLREGTADSDIIILGEGPELTTMYTERELRRDFKHTSPVQVSDASDIDVMPGWLILGV